MAGQFSMSYSVSAAAKPAKPFGRSLTDFETYIHRDGLPLWPAERKLLDDCRIGQPTKIGEQLPAEDTTSDDKRVRAGFIRFLILGGDDRAPVHEKGLQVIGALVDGDLDLEACEISLQVGLTACRLSRIVLEGASAKTIHLKGCHIEGLSGDNVRIAGELFLCEFDPKERGHKGGPANREPHDAFVSDGPVSLIGAAISGDLDLQGASIAVEKAHALHLDGARIDGAVNLHRLITTGAVRLNGATIKGDLDIDGAQLTGRELDDIAKVEKNAGPIAFCMHRASVGGRFFFSNLQECDGQLRLMYSSCAIFADDASLITGTPKLRAGDLILEGFTYERLYRNSPVASQSRIKWLELQPGDALTSRFQPQPWTQLANVLRNMGYEEAAKDIAIEREERQTLILRRGARLFHRLYGWLTRYGYRPQYIALYVLIIWLSGGFLYHHAYRGDGIVPIDPNKISDFNAWAYSIDYVLPVVSLGQSKEWRPNVPSEWRDHNAPPPPGTVKPRTPRQWIPGFLNAGEAARYATWIQTIFGWIAGFSLVAFLGGLANRNK